MARVHPEIRRFVFGLALLAGIGSAAAQVTPAEPFGGRPFGSDSAQPPLQPQPQPPRAAPPVVAQPGAAPVVVQPGAGPVVVQPQPQPQPQPQLQAQPQPQPPAAPGMAGPNGRPMSSVNPQPQGSTLPAQGVAPPSAQRNAPAMSAPAMSSPATGAPATNAPAPAAVSPPFTANRPALAAAGAAPAASPVRGLPADAPPLVISGAVYSPNPAQRMLIVNGQVFREGADLGSGVVLEQVHKDSAVLGFRGGRYNVFF